MHMTAAGNSRVDVGFIGIDGVSDDFTCSGRNDRKGLARTCRLFLAIDEQPSNGFGFYLRYGACRVRFVHVYLPGVSRKPQRQRKEGLAAELNPSVSLLFIVRSRYIYLNITSQILAWRRAATPRAARIRYPREKRAAGASPKTALTTSDGLVRKPIVPTTKRCNKTGRTCLT
jgi:hypothetical protein